MLFWTSLSKNPEKLLISEGSCYTEDWSNGCWKFSFAITGRNNILKYIQGESSDFKFQLIILQCHCICSIFDQMNAGEHRWINLYSSEWETTIYIFFAFPFYQIAKEKLHDNDFQKRNKYKKTDNGSQKREPCKIYHHYGSFLLLFDKMGMQNIYIYMVVSHSLLLYYSICSRIITVLQHLY